LPCESQLTSFKNPQIQSFPVKDQESKNFILKMLRECSETSQSIALNNENENVIFMKPFGSE